MEFADSDESPLVEKIREILLDAIRNPIPEDKLKHLMREMKIQMHREYARRAVHELRVFGKIDPLTQTNLDFGRQSMSECGIGSMALQIEKDEGLNVRE